MDLQGLSAEELAQSLLDGAVQKEALVQLGSGRLCDVAEMLMKRGEYDWAGQLGDLADQRDSSNLVGFLTGARARLSTGRFEVLAFVPERFRRTWPDASQRGAAVIAFLAWANGEDIQPVDVLDLVSERLAAEGASCEERAILEKASAFLTLATCDVKGMSTSLRWSKIWCALVVLLRRWILQTPYGTSLVH